MIKMGVCMGREEGEASEMVVVVAGSVWGVATDMPPTRGGQWEEMEKFLNDIIPWLDGVGLRQICFRHCSGSLPSDLRSRFLEPTEKIKQEK